MESAPLWVGMVIIGGSAPAHVNIWVPPNEYSVARSGVIVITSGTARAELPIRQAAAPVLSLSRSGWAAPAGGGSAAVAVSTDQEAWSSSAPGWLSVAPSSGGSGASALVVAEPNPGDSARAGVVRFEAGGLVRELAVTQVAGSLGLSRSSWSASASGAEAAVRVTSSFPVWSAVSDAGWLSVTPSGAAGGSVLVSAGRNLGEARSATVVVTAGEMVKTVSVSQGQGPSPSLSLARSSYSAGAGGDLVGVRVTTNQESWSAVADVPWLAVAPASGVTGEQVSVAVAANAGGKRSGTVSVRVDGPRGSVVKALTVTQDAATVSASSSSWSPSAGGATVTPKVTTNQALWTAEVDADWVVVMPESGVTGETMIWAAQANTGPKRTATITLRAGEVSKTIAVTQAAAPNPSLSLSKTTWAPSATENAIVVGVTTNQEEWQVSSDQKWLEAYRSLEMDTMVSPGSLVWVRANPTASARTATLTFTAGPVTKTLKVTQAAGPARFSLPESTVFGNPDGDGAESFVLAPVFPAGGTWTASASPSSWLKLSPTGSQPAGVARTVSLTANTSGETRVGTITVTSGGVSATHVVIQPSAANPVKLSKTSWSPSASGASTTATVTVAGGISWEAAADVDWLLAGPRTSWTEDTLTIVARPNTGPARVGTVCVSTSHQPTTCVTVTQQAAR
ncbi:MAG: hypothetical protein LBC97_00205 [Bifidobacteriaceae bacterium]|nr:hypothetical protein [Bifidobacteriaceae bacterium]